MSLVLFILLFLVALKLKDFMSKIFTPNIYFLNKNETEKFILDDKDKYLENLTPMDLSMRKFQSLDEYRKIIPKVVLDFTDVQKVILNDSIKEAQIALESLNNPYIDTPLISSIDWNIAITYGKNYEMGLPHTRGEIIFVTTDDIEREDIVKLLIHEKVHIYQRKYKRMFQKKLKENGYEVVGDRRERKDLRSNPDLDEYIYAKGDKVYKGRGGDEHPNEEIAYDIEKIYNIK